MKTINREYLTADEIYERAMKSAVALPCQESYARELAEILSYHLKKNCLMDQGYTAAELPYQSAMIVAPSGQGKSFLLRAMAGVCGVNVIVCECSNLTREGFKGTNLSEFLSNEKAKLNNSMGDGAQKAFERSIVLLDEVDKLRNWAYDSNRSNAQVNLLQLFSGEPITYSDGENSATIGTGRWTILLAGAFDGLNQIIENRLSVKRTIGFGESSEGRELSKAELLERAIPADLAQYGMLAELVGRVGAIIPIHPMEPEDYRLLVNGGSCSAADKQRRYLSAFYGASVEITDGAVEAIARKCIGSETGARAVNPLINAQLRKAETMLDRDKKIGKIIVDADGDELCVRYENARRKKPRKIALAAEKKTDASQLRQAEAGNAGNGTPPEKPAAPAQESDDDDDLALLRDAVHDFVEVTRDKTYVIRAGTVTETVNFLYMLYEEAGGDSDFRDRLCDFLTCTLLYWQKVYPLRKISLSCLFQMAVNVQKGSSGVYSRFEKDVASRICCENGEEDEMFKRYNLFSARWETNTSYRLVMALDKISQLLYRLIPVTKRCIMAERVYFDVKADESFGE